MSQNNLIDGFGRKISYLRLSLTDRCDLRCLYCMRETETFMPKKEILSAAEIAFLAQTLVARGVKKIRLTGGEPLGRKDFIDIARTIARLPLDEWTLTTNATLLPTYARELAALGLKRVNISLDSLDEKTFATITRGGKLHKTLDGIQAALDNGIKVKINCVALAKLNEADIPQMITWAHEQKMDFTLIETMPMSETGLDLTQHYVPLEKIRQDLENNWHLIPEIKMNSTAGPAQFFTISETQGRLGLITPISNKFCSACNRVRISADGKLWTCLGQNHFIDLKKCLTSNSALNHALDEAMKHKPLEHNFYITKNEVSGSPQRMMASTGG